MMEADTNNIAEEACLKVLPLNEKFSDILTHRDYLGALINLGVERDRIGDIYTDGTRAFVFCSPALAQFFVKELKKVKNTFVSCEAVDPSECDIEPQFEQLHVNVASERIDAVISGVFHVSRNIAKQLIDSEFVTIDGKTVKKSGTDIPVGAKVGVRRHGKFIYQGIENTSKKGRLFVTIDKYI